MKFNSLKFKVIVRKYYRDKRRVLPWRKEAGELQDPYLTLVSEIMLQQTQVVKVKKYFNNFCEKWPNIQTLANANIDQVLAMWSGLGYYKRAISLHKCANIIMKDYKGIVPEEETLLLTLPGIGTYTAAAIRSIAFGKYAVIIDSNIDRIFSRVCGIIANSRLENKKKVRMLASQIFPSKKTGDFAQALMDIGATFCLAHNPKCTFCPLNDNCIAYNENNIDRIPFRKKKKTKKIKYTYVFVMRSENDSIFVIKRPFNGLLGGMIDFPSTEWADKWMKDKELFAYKPLNIKWLKRKKVLYHSFSHFNLKVRVMYGEVSKDKVKLKGFWLQEKNYDGLALSSLTKKVLKSVGYNITY